MDKQTLILELTIELVKEYYSILVKHVPTGDWNFSLLFAPELEEVLKKLIKQHIEQLPKVLAAKVDPTEMLLVALKDLRTGAITLGDFEISLHNKVDKVK